MLNQLAPLMDVDRNGQTLQQYAARLGVSYSALTKSRVYGRPIFSTLVEALAQQLHRPPAEIVALSTTPGARVRVPGTKPPATALGERLEEARATTGLSRAAYAQTLAIHPTELSRLRTNRRQPSRAVIHKLAAHLGVPAAEIARLATTPTDASQLAVVTLPAYPARLDGVVARRPPLLPRPANCNSCPVYTECATDVARGYTAHCEAVLAVEILGSPAWEAAHKPELENDYDNSNDNVPL